MPGRVLHLLLLGQVIACTGLGVTMPAVALPDPADIPEEVLRHQEQILGGRSPLDNAELEYEAYQVLMADLTAAQATTPQLSPELQQTIMLLQMLKLVRSVSPF